MCKYVVVFVSTLLLCLGANPSVAEGQTAPPQQPRLGSDPYGGRFFVNLSGAFQAGGGDIEQDATFPLYEEDAQLRIDQSTGTGAQFDFGAGYRLRELLGVRDRVGVGFAYSRGSGTGDATVTGNLPNPLFFGQPRPVAGSAGGLRRTENAVHLQAIWWVPFTEDIDFAVSLGPSIFFVRQDLTTGVVFTETPPYDTVQVDAVNVARQRRKGAGFNIGVDGTYRLTPRFGAGVLLRYSRGWVGLDLTETEEVTIHPGGFQIGVGLRVRFDRPFARRPTGA